MEPQIREDTDPVHQEVSEAEGNGGSKGPSRRVRIRLRQYTGVRESPESGYIEYSDLPELLANPAGAIRPGFQTGEVMLKWLYAFRKSDRIELEAEAFVSHSTCQLAPETEYFLLVSDVRLQAERIREYAADPGLLAARAVHLAKDWCPPGQSEATVAVVDFIGIAYALNGAYQLALARLDEFLAFDGTQDKLAMVGMIHAVADQEPAIKRWLDYDSAMGFFATSQSGILARKVEINRSMVRKTEWMGLTGTVESIADHFGDRRSIDRLVETMNDLSLDDFRSEAGKSYLRSLACDRRSWLHRIVNDGETVDAVRQGANLAMTNAKAWLANAYIAGRSWEILERIEKGDLRASPELKAGLERFADDVERIVVRISGLQEPSLHREKGRYIWVDAGSDLCMLNYRLPDGGSRHTGELGGFIGEIPGKGSGFDSAARMVFRGLPGLQAAMSFVELVNIRIVIQQLREKQDMESTLSLGGDLVDVVSASQFFLEMHRKMRFDRAFNGLALAGSLFDYLYGYLTIYRRKQDDSTGLLAGNVLYTLGSVFAGASSALELHILRAGAATVFGLSAMKLLILGFAFYFAGSLLRRIYTDSPLEKWARSSFWGEGKGEDLQSQLSELGDILEEARKKASGRRAS